MRGTHPRNIFYILLEMSGLGFNLSNKPTQYLLFPILFSKIFKTLTAFGSILTSVMSFQPFHVLLHFETKFIYLLQHNYKLYFNYIRAE